MSVTAPIANEEALLQRVISHFLNFGARASDDARWFVSVLPGDLQAFFRSEFLQAIRAKSGDDAAKARKFFLSLGQTARAIFASEYSRTKKQLRRGIAGGYTESG